MFITYYIKDKNRYYGFVENGEQVSIIFEGKEGFYVGITGVKEELTPCDSLQSAKEFAENSWAEIVTKREKQNEE